MTTNKIIKERSETGGKSRSTGEKITGKVNLSSWYILTNDKLHRAKTRSEKKLIISGVLTLDGHRKLFREKTETLMFVGQDGGRGGPRQR